MDSTPISDQQPSKTPPMSAVSSPSPRKGSRTPLSLDLSSLPPLSQPSPPSNTLLITDLNDLSIFHPASLATIRSHVDSIAPLHSWSPLKSFRRIVCSFYDIDSAIKIRQLLDGESILGASRSRVYFGEPTPIEPSATRHLKAPQSDKLFFISPPPSPPHGWEMKNEDPPNKAVHASDLAEALAKLRASGHIAADPNTPTTPSDTAAEVSRIMRTDSGLSGSGRVRSGSSTVIYDPETHGDSPALPAVMVEDTTIDNTDDMKLDDGETRIIAHTSRPPVELMDES